MAKSGQQLKVAVIGAGVSGLGAIKCCAEEGLDVVCFERSNDVGGLWNYVDDIVDGRSTVMRSTIINTSKETTGYSDFPMPDDFPNYAHNTKFLEYIRLYCDRFQLLRHIRFETDVLKVSYAGDDVELTGNGEERFAKGRGTWDIVSKDLRTSTVVTERFDAVMVCSGHHADKKMAHFEGEEEFEGKIIHSHDYRDHRGYEDKRVVVVGIGNSGGDVATELGKIAKQTFLSTRRGAWVIHRVWDNGLPLDVAVVSRLTDCIFSILPFSARENFMKKVLNKKFDHSLYGLRPNHNYFAQHPTVNDDLPNRIIAGVVIVKPDIRRVTKHGIEFVDGTTVDDVDVIICATGYIFGFPFIDHPAFSVENNQVNLYKYVFSPDVVEHGSQGASTIAVIGCFQPLGGLIPISELQARWAIRVFKGECKLPSREDMWADINKTRELMRKRYVDSSRHTIQVDVPVMQHELRELVGCSINMWRLLFTDPRLWYHLIVGPYCPYQNRLVGPGAWPGAREAILTTMDRVRKPFQTRTSPKMNGVDMLKKAETTDYRMMILIIVGVILAIFFTFYS